MTCCLCIVFTQCHSCLEFGSLRCKSKEWQRQLEAIYERQNPYMTMFGLSIECWVYIKGRKSGTWNVWTAITKLILTSIWPAEPILLQMIPTAIGGGVSQHQCSIDAEWLCTDAERRTIDAGRRTHQWSMNSAGNRVLWMRKIQFGYIESRGYDFSCGRWTMESFHGSARKCWEQQRWPSCQSFSL